MSGSSYDARIIFFVLFYYLLLICLFITPLAAKHTKSGIKHTNKWM